MRINGLFLAICICFQLLTLVGSQFIHNAGTFSQGGFQIFGSSSMQTNVGVTSITVKTNFNGEDIQDISMTNPQIRLLGDYCKLFVDKIM